MTLMFSDCVVGPAPQPQHIPVLVVCAFKPEEVEILRRGKVRMGLASLAFYPLEVIFFFSQLAKDLF